MSPELRAELRDLGPVGPDAVDALWVADWTRTQALILWGAE